MNFRLRFRSKPQFLTAGGSIRKRLGFMDSGIWNTSIKSQEALFIVRFLARHEHPFQHVNPIRTPIDLGALSLEKGFE